MLVIFEVDSVALSHGIWTLGVVTVTLCHDLIWATCCKCHITMSGSRNKKLPGEDHLRWPPCLFLADGGSSGVSLIAHSDKDDLLAQKQVQHSQQPIPYSTVWADWFYCPICRQVCVIKSSVCFWKQLCGRACDPDVATVQCTVFILEISQIKQIQTSLFSLVWFFYWQSVFGVRQVHTGYKEEFHVDTHGT